VLHLRPTVRARCLTGTSRSRNDLFEPPSEKDIAHTLASKLVGLVKTAASPPLTSDEAKNGPRLGPLETAVSGGSQQRLLVARVESTEALEVAHLVLNEASGDGIARSRESPRGVSVSSPRETRLEPAVRDALNRPH